MDQGCDRTWEPARPVGQSPGPKRTRDPWTGVGDPITPTFLLVHSLAHAVIKRLSFERAYLALLQTLELPVEPTRPEEFLPQFIDELSVSDSDAFEQAARELLISAREVDPMSGRSPSGLAASALYATACVHDEPVTQEELSKLSDTSKVIIRIGYQDLLDVGSWE